MSESLPRLLTLFRNPKSLEQINSGLGVSGRHELSPGIGIQQYIRGIIEVGAHWAFCQAAVRVSGLTAAAISETSFVMWFMLTIPGTLPRKP